MEPASQEVDSTTPFVSDTAPPFSGIRAVPSRDDSDGESFLFGDSAAPDEIRNEGFSSSDSSSGESAKEEFSVKSVGDDGSEDNFGESMAEFETPRGPVPRAKVSAEEEGDEEEEEDDVVIGGEEDEGVSGEFPRVRASRDGELEVEDGYKTAVAGLRDDKGVGFDDIVSENGDVEEGGVNVLEDNGVKFTGEGDAIVDSVRLDEVEAVRSGAALVGGGEESTESEGKESENSAAQEPAGAGEVGDTGFSETKEDEVSGVEEKPSLADADTGFSETKEDEVSGVEEKPSLANAVAVTPDESKDGDVVAEEVNGVEDSEASSALVTDEIKDEAGVDGVKGVEDSKVNLAETVAPEKPDLELTEEGDSVVDKINVDVVEAIRSGTAVVGEQVGAKENGSAVDEISSTGVESPKHERDTSENGSAADVHTSTGVESSEHEKESAENGFEVTSTGVEPSQQEKDHVENGSTFDEVLTTGVEASEHENNTVDVAGNAEIPSAVDNLTLEKAAAEQQSDHDEVSKTHLDESEKQDKALGLEASSEATENAVAEPESNFEGLKAKVLEQKDVATSRDIENLQRFHVANDVSETDDRNSKMNLDEPEAESKAPGSEVTVEENDILEMEEDNAEGSTDDENDGMIFGSSAAARQFMQELERASGADSRATAGSSREHSEQIDGQMATDSEDEEGDSDNEQDGKELFDSAALAALLKAATNANVDPSNLTVTSQDGTRLFSVERPAGLGPSLRPPVRYANRPHNPYMFSNPNAPTVSEESLSEDEKKKLDKLQQLRVKFLRLVYRLGHSPEDSVAAQVLYRLALAAGRPNVPSFSLEAAKQSAQKLEEEGTDDLSLSLNILVLGKLGVGKSATINSIFGEEKVKIDAFEPGTTAVSEITGIVNGVNVRVFDTPGLRSSALEQGFNRKILSSVKKFTKNSPPDIVLYVDRLDSQTRDLNDLPLLRTISSTLGATIWRNAIVALTHAACAPPDGPSGSPLSYEVFVAQRSHIVQQYIGQAMGDFRLMSPGVMSPVTLVENHLACRRNREGQKVLPNGQTWRPQLLLLCFSMKILSEASFATRAQDAADQKRLFGFRVRSPPLPYLLSSLLQPRAHPKLSADQGGDNADSDVDLDDLSDLEKEDEEEDEYDQLPPFKPLRKAQIAKLTKEQSKAYFEEYDYRVKLLQKKQWKEELKRMRDMKNKGPNTIDEYGQRPEDFDQDDATPAAVPVPLPDMVLPPTFDGDNPAYRYRFLEPTSQFLARPVLDTHGWDHDCGYDGVNVEQSLGIAGRFPAAVTVQVTKDKKDFNLHMDSSVAAKHGENGSSLVGFDIQNIGKQLGYIVRGETKFKNLKKNKTAAGVSVTFLGENVATGVKVEDQVSIGKRLVFVGSTGTVRSQKDAAYGANLELRLRDADYPIGQDQSSFVLSLMKWRGDLALGANFQSQVSVGRNSKVAVRVALNNKLSGQITVRTSSSDHLQLALAGLVPIALSIFRSLRPGVSEKYSIY